MSKHPLPPSSGGYVFAEDPERSARDALLFWDAATDRNVIRASARLADANAGQTIRLADFPWPIAILQQRNREELAIRAPQGIVRLSIVEGTMLDGPVTLDYRVGGPGLAERLQALARWDCLLRTGSWPQALVRSTPRADRWPLILATMDALASGHSLRETAVALFGRETVDREWHQPSDHLKMRTRRFISHARRLAEGGYRDLL